MAGTSAIEWTDATFNPWWGCERVSPACAHCYADTLARRYGFGDTWGAGHGFRFFGDKHWAEPVRWNRRAEREGRRLRVFCASMADVFEERPELDEHRERLFDLITRTPYLDWQLLTKRPEFARDWLAALPNDGWASRERTFLREFGGALPNVWLGVSIENARFTWRADVLREIPAAVHFISAEPLLGSLFDAGTPCVCGGTTRSSRSGLAVCVECGARRGGRAPLDLTGIDWVIIGGESGAKARPMRLEWAREIVDACRAAGVAPFVKQLGAKPTGKSYIATAHGPSTFTLRYGDVPLKLRDRKGGDWDEWPADLRIREFPTRAAVEAC
jgi:protein gp37